MNIDKGHIKTLLMQDQDFIFNLQWEPSDIISIILLGFLFFWGVALLYQKWIRNHDFPFWLDLLSLILMFTILGIQLLQLRDWLKNYTLLYILSALGLFITVSALYSHSFISLTTLIFLSIIQPGEEFAPDVPRFGPAEILEHENDWKGALNEYFVLARIYPHHPSVHLRIANAYVKLNQPKEALQWLKKSLNYLKREEDIYMVIARYCDIAQDIGDIDSAMEIINYHLKQYPNSPHSKSILERKKRMSIDITKERSSLLVPMEETPIDENLIDDKNRPIRGKLKIEKIQSEDVNEDTPIIEQSNEKKSNNNKSTLSRLEPM